MLANLTHDQTWALQTDEARALAEAAAEVAKHYDVPGLNPKHAALASFAIVAGQIYVPRAIGVVMGTPASRPAQAAPTAEAEHAAGSGGSPPSDPATPPWFGGAPREAAMQ